MEGKVQKKQKRQIGWSLFQLKYLNFMHDKENFCNLQKIRTILKSAIAKDV